MFRMDAWLRLVPRGQPEVRGTNGDPSMKTHQSPRILVVESDDDTAGSIERLLADRFGALVEVSYSLANARQLLAEGIFDVISVSYLLPDGTGLELLTEIASRGGPPVIIVTGQGNEEIAAWAVRDGASGYVLKNDKMEGELCEAVRRALERGALYRVQNALEESEAFYRSLFDNSADALFIETLDGVIEDANLAACELYGYEPEELRGMNATEFVPDNLKADFESALTRLLAGEPIEFENLRSDGTKFPVRVFVEEVLTRRGARYVVRLRDLSDMKRAEQTAEQERAFTMQTLNTLTEVFALIDLDGHYFRWNKALNDVTGYTDEEITALRHRDFHPLEDIPKIERAIRRVMETGEPQRTETSLVTKEGKAIPYDLSAALIRDEKGEPFAIIGLGRDVSERRRAEEALRTMVKETNARREEITALLESTRLVLEHVSFEQTAADIFRLCKELVGATRGYVCLFTDRGTEMVLTDPELPEDERSRVMPVDGLHGKDFDHGKPLIENSIASSEFPERMPDGHLEIRNLMLAPLVIGSETVGLIGLANKGGGFNKRDSLMAAAFGEIVSIALQNFRNSQAVRESEERFRSVAETANEAIICADSGGNITFWNPGASAMFGYTAEEAMDHSLAMIIPERLRQENLKSFIRSAGDSESSGRTYELIGIKKDGTEFHMELSRSSPWIIGDDVSVTAIIRDISERKEAEEALARSAAEYRAVVEEQTELITRYQPDGKISFVNEANARMFGMTREEMTQLDSYYPLIPEEDHELVRETISKISLEQPSVSNDHRVIDGDGNVRWMQWRNRGIFDEDGNLVEYQAVGRDITPEKVAEEALRESEQRFRLLFDTAQDVIYSISSEGVIITLNSAFEKWTGFIRDEWLGKPFAPIVHPDDLPLAVQTFQQATTGGHPAPYELRIMKKDGDYITAEFISAPLLKGDEIVGEFGIARDISERKEAQRLLAESEELYRGLLATSPDPVVVTDLDFTVTMVSDRAVEQQRVEGPEDLIGRNAMEVIMPEGAKRAREEAGRMMETGQTRPMEFTLSRRDSTTFIGEMTASLLRDPDGNPKAFITTIRDVTERKRAEHELQMLNNELEGYAHAVSHDLKGPLSSIGAASITIQSLLKGELDAESMEGLDEMAAIISSNIEKSNRLIEDLLELAEAGQRPYDTAEVSIAEVVSEVLAERRDLIKSKKVKVKTSDDLGKVVASRTHMYQLFSNLIDNAIKHNDARKPIVAVEYLGRAENGAHRYTVKDNGPGIPDDQADRVFLPFVSGVADESGIGLATVEKIVGVYGGTVAVCNEGGACFEFEINDLR
jgi:two-component system, cell cycle sensor histidine kinase and response regulator CckA